MVGKGTDFVILDENVTLSYLRQIEGDERRSRQDPEGNAPGGGAPPADDAPPADPQAAVAMEME